MKKIWSDPVWSKVISTGIIAVLGFIIVFVYSLCTDKAFGEVFKYLISYQLPVFWIVVIIMVLILLIYVISFLLMSYTPSEDKYLKRKEKAFVGNNYKYLFEDVNVLCRYSVYVSSLTGKPFVSNLKLYCKNHGNVPIEMIGSDCNISGCSNVSIGMRMFDVERILESDIIHHWEEYDIKNKK